MASRRSNHGLRIVNTDTGDHEAGASRAGTLAETPFSGKSRLLELEQLAKTARKVRDDAESELANSQTSRAIAEQRISTCERTLHKAEDEMARIRAELYRQEQAGEEEGDYKSAEEFELAVLLGKSAKQEKPSEEDIANLQLAPLPKREKQHHTARSVPFHGVPREPQIPVKGKSRRAGFTLLVTAGALIGASLTYTALKTPSIQEKVMAVAADPAQLIEELSTTADAEHNVSPAVKAEPVIQTAPDQENAGTPERVKPSGNADSPNPQVNVKPDIFQRRAIEEQRTRIIREAETDLESRLVNPPAVAASNQKGK